MGMVQNWRHMMLNTDARRVIMVMMHQAHDNNNYDNMQMRATTLSAVLLRLLLWHVHHAHCAARRSTQHAGHGSCAILRPACSGIKHACLASATATAATIRWRPVNTCLYYW
jgi:hypothetical protein